MTAQVTEDAKFEKANPVVPPVLPKGNGLPTLGPVLLRASDITPIPVEWLWQDRIPIGKVTLIAGDPGLGKSLVTLDLAARVTTSKPWPDDPEYAPPRGGVVLLSAEDDPADTIVPRLQAAGADLDRINILTAIRLPGNDRERTKHVDLATDLPHIESAITQTTDCRLVVIDPISAYLGKTDSHNNSEVRGLLAPLGELAARHRVAIVVVTHLTKGEGAAMYRSMGSLAFVAAARAAWVVARDKADPGRRLFLPLKNNIGLDSMGMAFRVITPGPHVEWEPGPVTITADEALAIERPRRQQRSVEEITSKKGGSITPRELMRSASRYKDSIDKAEAALQDLVDDGIGRWGAVTTTASGGRPTRRFYLSDGSGEGSVSDGEGFVSDTAERNTDKTSCGKLIDQTLLYSEENEGSVNACGSEQGGFVNAVHITGSIDETYSCATEDVGEI